MIGQFQYAAGLPAIEFESETLLQANPAIRNVCHRSSARMRPRETNTNHSEVLDMTAFFIYQSEIESVLQVLTGGRTGEYRRFRSIARRQRRDPQRGRISR